MDVVDLVVSKNWGETARCDHVIKCGDIDLKLL